MSSIFLYSYMIYFFFYFLFFTILFIFHTLVFVNPKHLYLSLVPNQHVVFNTPPFIIFYSVSLYGHIFLQLFIILPSFLFLQFLPFIDIVHFTSFYMHNFISLPPPFPFYHCFTLSSCFCLCHVISFYTIVSLHMRVSFLLSFLFCRLLYLPSFTYDSYLLSILHPRHYCRFSFSVI